LTGELELLLYADTYFSFGSIAHCRIFESGRSVVILLTSPVEIRQWPLSRFSRRIQQTAAYKVYRPVDQKIATGRCGSIAPSNGRFAANAGKGGQTQIWEPSAPDSQHNAYSVASCRLAVAERRNRCEGPPTTRTPHALPSNAESVARRGNSAPQNAPGRWVVSCRSTFSETAVRGSVRRFMGGVQAWYGMPGKGHFRGLMRSVSQQRRIGSN